MADINLRSIKRTDQSVEAIVENATQVAVYKYCPSTNEWQKLEVEGSLFVFARNCGTKHASQARFGFIIMNQKTTTNMVEDINGNLELSMDKPYLLYKNSHGGIFCVWFYNALDCNKIHETIRNLLDKPDTAYISMPQPNCGQLANGDKKNDVMDLLMRGLQRNGINAGGAATTTPNAKSHQQNFNSSNTHSTSTINSTTTQNGTGSQPNTINPSVQELLSSMSLSPQKPSFPGQSAPNHTSTPQRPSASNHSATNGVASSQKGARRSKLDTSSTSPPALTNKSQSGQSIRPMPDGHHYDQGLGSNSVASGPPERPLSMQQLKTTLVQLLKNDADFLHTIHSAYLETYQMSN